MSLFGGSPKLQPPDPVALPSSNVPDPTSPDAQAARARLLLLQKGKQGLQSTILTSPTGLMSNSASGSTLLGS